jgi:MerR family copper efflux transcriptional regulator
MRARTIGVLAKEVGVNVETIRFYERSGLLKQPPQPPRGWRVYDEGAVWTVRYIRTARRVGFSLESLRELIPHLRDGSDFCRDFHVSLERQQLRIERELARLLHVRSQLERIRARCKACPHDKDCPILRHYPRPAHPGRRPAMMSARS